ncbi:hypothetical protein RJ641_025762 [Dillenia turbinata]|uniref:Retrovirus-related Pol polyprotein from transposon TNT 1-94-like beta-barrel domain-containing protein n=1 Tax=Dillenia turbinata TaxID=194707 RepID=A0AAN8W278_9MAGN
MLFCHLSLPLSPTIMSVVIIMFTFYVFNFVSGDSNNLPPGPFAIPVFGNWLQVGNNWNHRLLVSMLDRSHISKVRVGNGDCIEVKRKGDVIIKTDSSTKLITNGLFVPEIDQNLLSIGPKVWNFGSRPSNIAFDIFTGNGQDIVFTVYGDHHRKMRRMMTLPSFTKDCT